MRPGITVTLNSADHHRLKAFIADRNTPQKRVWRAEIVLLWAESLGTVEVMRRMTAGGICDGRTGSKLWLTVAAFDWLPEAVTMRLAGSEQP